ncbi:YhgE/Pip domain-containing protein [Shouchella patagoniensis]|uniref:YhgE/Pip domain-containing protein n=1 Tax=Shouchella patagoniensis TaxID=228576 RepID=UPI0009949D73|nr:ABC transporter permease [Shouchella patagoniensis]
MGKNKLFLSVPLIAVLVLFILSLTLIPSVNPQPEDVPIAIVNEDIGVKVPNQGELYLGNKMIELLLSVEEENSVVDWIEVKSTEEVINGLDEKEYYGAFIIPEEFSQKQASLRTAEPTSPHVEIIINEGKNYPAATMVNQVLNDVVENVNDTVRSQLLEEFQAEGGDLTVKQVTSLVNPIEAKTTKVNQVGENSANGNAPVTFFQPLWMSVLASAAILCFVTNKQTVLSQKENARLALAKVLMGAIASIVIGFALPWVTDAVIGLTMPSYLDTALFLTITAFSFILMILAVLSIVGIRGVPLFVVLLFFGAPLLSLAPEMMPSFYANWIYPWLPMRFMVEGLRDLFYFGNSLSWEMVSVLVWIAFVSLVVIMLTALKGKNTKK